MKRALCVTACLWSICFGAAVVHAQADLGPKGAGGRLSLVSPNDVDATIGFGGLVDFGTITPELGLEATLDLWFKTESVGEFEAKFRDVIFGARAKYRFELSDPSLKPFAATGLALHLFHTEVPGVPTSGGGTTTIDDTSAKLGVDLAGGLGYTAGSNVDLFAELMYRIVSDVGQLVVSGGVMFWFN